MNKVVYKIKQLSHKITSLLIFLKGSKSQESITVLYSRLSTVLLTGANQISALSRSEVMEYSVPVRLLHSGVNVEARVSELRDLSSK